MKRLLAFGLLMTMSALVQAETVYLVIKSEASSRDGTGLAIHSIPMKTMDACEEAGALLIASERFDIKYSRRDAFECIEGK